MKTYMSYLVCSFLFFIGNAKGSLTGTEVQLSISVSSSSGVLLDDTLSGPAESTALSGSAEIPMDPFGLLLVDYSGIRVSQLEGGQMDGLPFNFANDATIIIGGALEPLTLTLTWDNLVWNGDPGFISGLVSDSFNVAPDSVVFDDDTIQMTWEVSSPVFALVGSGYWAVEIAPEETVDPVGVLELLAEAVAAQDLHKGIKNALLAKLLNAHEILLNDLPDDDASACETLGAFIHHVHAQRGKKIAPETADTFTEAAEAIRALICPEEE